MLRHTKRQRRATTKTTRITRKYKQSGGADWVALPEPRKSEWAAKLGDDFSLITGDGTGDETQHVNQYLNVIRRQDELFTAALKIIGEKLGVDIGDANAILANAEQIDASGSELFAYFIDVERMIQFVEDDSWKEVRQRQQVADPTKLQAMRWEPLSTHLLFPNRFTNLFVTALASIIVDLSDPQNVLLGQAANEATRPILADQFMAFAHSMAYTLTARDLRDGFFLNQGIQGFQTEIKEFWPAFIAAAVRYQTVTDAAAVIADKQGDCPSGVTDADSWGVVAAKVLRLHQLGRLADILTLFVECGTPPVTIDGGHTPPESVLDVNFDGKGTTLRKLYRNMDDVTLQFILQLTYTIQRLVHSTTTSSSSSTSSSTNATEEQTGQTNLPESGVSTTQTAP